MGLARCNPKPDPTRVLFRGNPHSPTDEVQPAFPQIFGGGVPEIPPPTDSARSAGRRKVLADWIASADNRLTSRVMAIVCGSSILDVASFAAVTTLVNLARHRRIPNYGLAWPSACRFGMAIEIDAPFDHDQQDLPDGIRVARGMGSRLIPTTICFGDSIQGDLAPKRFAIRCWRSMDR